MLVTYDYAIARPMPVPDDWRRRIGRIRGATAGDRYRGCRAELDGRTTQRFDLLILGGGMSYVGAIRAAQLGLNVGLVERDGSAGRA